MIKSGIESAADLFTDATQGIENQANYGPLSYQYILESYEAAYQDDVQQQDLININSMIAQEELFITNPYTCRFSLTETFVQQNENLSFKDKMREIYGKDAKDKFIEIYGEDGRRLWKEYRSKSINEFMADYLQSDRVINTQCIAQQIYNREKFKMMQSDNESIVSVTNAAMAADIPNEFQAQYLIAGLEYFAVVRDPYVKKSMEADAQAWRDRLDAIAGAAAPAIPERKPTDGPVLREKYIKPDGSAVTITYY